MPTDNVKFDGYYEIAEHLIAGGGFSRVTTPGYPDSVRTPLYPLLIAGLLTVFGSYKVLFLLQAVLGSISAVLVWLLAKEFLGRGRAAFLVGIAAAAEPLSAYLTGVILTETVFVFLFLLLLVVLLRYIKNPTLPLIALVSVLFGVATLVKPTLQYVPFVLIPMLWYVLGKQWSKKFFIHSVVLLGIFLAILAPWLYRNYKVFNNASLVVQPVSNLYAYLVPSTIALEQHIPFQQAQDAFYEKEGVNNIDDINLGNAKEFKARALAELKHHPKGLIESLGITAYAFFLNDGYYSVLQRFFGANISTHISLALLKGPGIVIVLGRVFWLVVFVLSLWGAFKAWKKPNLRTQLLLYVGLIAYFAATTAVIGLAVNGRFRIPVDPILFILAAYGVRELYFLAKSKWR